MVSDDYVLEYVRAHPGCSAMDIVRPDAAMPKYKLNNLRTNADKHCRKL